MRVLVKVNRLDLGGTQLNALDFAIAGQEHGIESFIAGDRESLPSSGPSLLDVAAERGVRIHLLESTRRAQRLARTRELSALADRVNADVIHSYSGFTARPAYWGPCRFGRRPHVITVYEMFVPTRVYRSPQLIVGTQYLVEDLADRRGRVYLVSPPVDLDRDRPHAGRGGDFVRSLELATEHLRLVIVSRLDDEMKARGIELVIDAMQSLARDHIDLVVVGGGNAEQRLRARADRLNQHAGRRAVTLTGSLPDPRPAYSCADIVIGMGGSAARALAFAKPLIVTGQREWFRTFTPQTSATLFRNSFWSDAVLPNPIEELIGQVRDLASNPTERDELGRFGRGFAETNFGLENMTRRLVDIYRTSIEEPRRVGWFADLWVEAASVRDGLLTRVRTAPT